MNRLFKFTGLIILVLILITVAITIKISKDQAMWFVYTSQDRAYPQQNPGDFGLNYEEVSLTTQDGITLAAWYIPTQNSAAVIAQHGYRSNRAEVLPAAEILARHGYGVLMMDARAHGDSQGEMVTFGLKEIWDVRAGLDYLISRPDVDPGKIGALGNSQGAVTLLLAAAQFTEIRAYVGDSPYAALQDEIATGVEAITGLSAFPFAPLIRFFAEREAGVSADAVAPINHVAAIAPRPVFFLQGGQDMLVPPNSGHRLYAAAREPRKLWLEGDLGHVAFVSELPDEYERRVIGFFDQYLLGY